MIEQGGVSRSRMTRRNFLIHFTVLSSSAVAGLRSDPVKSATESKLGSKVNTYIKGLRRSGRIARDERTAWSIYDFTAKQKLVSINEETLFQSASMIKPFVAQAFFILAKRDKRRYRYNKKNRLKMESMIRDSNNNATNYFIDLISRRSKRKDPAEVSRVLKSYAKGVFRNVRIVERIPRNGRTYKNKATAKDYSRFLYAIWNNQLPSSKEMKRLMGLPNPDRISNKVPRIPHATKVYDKTGTTARLCGDMGIVSAKGKDGKRYSYTFIAIIEKQRRAKSYGAWQSARGDVIRKVSAMAYAEMKRRYNLR